MELAKNRGINRIVLIGEGEPLLHPQIEAIIAAAKDLGLFSNIITNGTLPIAQYEKLFEIGLNHLQLSAHNLGSALDEIMETKGAGTKQAELLSWLSSSGLPFRTNTALQQLNYKTLPEITNYLIHKGAFHVALLGFLPHYEWKQYAAEVAVHPATLRPFIEAAAKVLIASGTYFTIRYHPFCQLSPEYWKYVVNARYVLYDPFEWDYGYYNPNYLEVWPAALAMGESVAVQEEPCTRCAMRLHCGGWNKYYAGAFLGADLKRIITGAIPNEYWKLIPIHGGLHDLNPANRLKGYCVNGEAV
jgi:MoaA/NifB/PqqE/SkfB family radical SAM enzyme